jgi:Na+-driven multidrug efflux pump
MHAKRINIAGLSLLQGSLIVAFFVTAEEFSQLLLKHRGFSLIDLACDYLGIIAFGILADHWVRARQAKQTTAP